MTNMLTLQNRSRGLSRRSVSARTGSAIAALFVLGSMLLPLCAWAQSEVPQGTRFLVELNDRLDAGRVHRGQHFNARTLEDIQTADGSVIPAGAVLSGRVAYVRKNEMQLQFDRIRANSRSMPIVADVVGVQDEHGVKQSVDDEGDISSTGGGHVKHGLVGAVIGGAAGAGVGAIAGGGSGAAKGAAIGGAGGAAIGATKGHKRLVLPRGTRLQLELGAPLAFQASGD